MHDGNENVKSSGGMTRMQLSGFTFQGPPVEAAAISELPPAYRALLTQFNGLIAFSGGLHLRGVCSEPAWHSLTTVMSGDYALHRLFPAICATDLPFGQDCLGDQFVLRDGIVQRLSGESGLLSSTECRFGEFLDRAAESPVDFLQLQPLLQFESEGGRLMPGYSLSAVPPFIMQEAGGGVSLRAVPMLERIAFLADVARQIRDVPDGAFVEFRIVN